MRRNVASIALVLTMLGTPMFLSSTVANAGPGSTPAAQPGLPSGVEISPFESAGLGDLLESLVDGTSPLITEVQPSQAISPFGQEVNDDSGESTIQDEFEIIINPSSFAALGDLDLDGTVDIAKAGNPSGPAADEPATLVRVEGDGQLNQIWGDYAFLDGFEDGLVPTFGPTADSNFTGGSDDVIDTVLRQLGVDPFGSGTQDALGTQVQIARPMNDRVPYRGPITVWGGHTVGDYASGIDCGRSMYVYEFGRAFSRAGGQQWTPGEAFPYDLFTGASDASIVRCDGNRWHTDNMVNTGANFESVPTNTTAIVFHNGFVAFTPSEELINTIGYRVFSFRTPVSGGYQPNNTIATTYPTFPNLMTPMPLVVVGEPFPTADYGPFPVLVNFASLDAGTEANPCSGDWSANFETYLFDNRTDGEMGAALYQFASGQWSTGRLTYVDGQPNIVTEGSGADYTEMFNITGSVGEYVYMTDGGECPYSISLSDGADAFIEALAEFAPAVTTDSAPAETETPSTPTTPPTSESTSSTPPVSESSSPAATTDDGGDDGGGFPWGPVAIIVGIIVAIGGYVLTRNGSDGDDGDDVKKPPTPTGAASGPTTVVGVATEGPCDRLRRMLADAKTNADAKRKAANDADAAADDAETKAGQAATDATDANTSAKDAEADRKTAERNRNAPDPRESESWIEDSETGERITGTDLRLRREAAGEAWDGYKSDPSADSAAETEDKWSHLDDEGARAKRKADDEADQAKRAKALADAEAAEDAAKTASDEAKEARDAADQTAKDARAEADRLETDAEASEARVSELERDLAECLGLTTGDPTRWGGPVGLGEDPNGGCFPEGNIERRVLDTFNKNVKVNWWVTVRPTESGSEEAQRLAGEMRWWRDAFGGGSSAINVAGAVKGLTTRTVKDAVDTAASGASVVGGGALGIDIPTNIYQVPLVVLEGLAAISSTIFGAVGRMIEDNGVEQTVEYGFQVRKVNLTWFEIWKCEGGVKRCVERVFEADMGKVNPNVFFAREVFLPREKWQSRVERRGRTVAGMAQESSQDMMNFMGKYKAGPC